ncbi:hypothetical protein B0T17DRAFT_648961 [Bombardia bombarda]|uniref:Uncharacterized protein n=1 Tax=Bombardia bombarda TaxID=252184 RepID=A0AA39T2C5_9PEZI|nr:hypothetical protein B0T17DRAFT_648961 [Bombardia bombarda]
MSSLLTTLGLRASSSSSSPVPLPITNHAPALLIFNFIFAYGLLSSRTLKQYYGIDHNASPREDLTKYGPAAVRAGKITQKQLDTLKRNEAAHANAVENYALLVAALGLATAVGVKGEVVNRAGVVYTLARAAYAVVYVTVADDRWSQARGCCWWVGNGSCFWLLWRAWGVLALGGRV